MEYWLSPIIYIQTYYWYTHYLTWLPKKQKLTCASLIQQAILSKRYDTQTIILLSTNILIYLYCLSKVTKRIRWALLTIVFIDGNI